MNTTNATRFQKGQSGNPGGRPRKQKLPVASAFDILFDRTLSVTQGGVTRALTVEEALQHKLYEHAIAGKRIAIRGVLKMIAIREKALAARAPPAPPIKFIHELTDPDNAYDALLILGIALPDPAWEEQFRERRLLLEPWAVQTALRRKGVADLKDRDLSEIRRTTYRAETIKWPRSFAP